MPECWGKSEVLKKLLQAGKMGNSEVVPQKRKGKTNLLPIFSQEEREHNFWAKMHLAENGCWEWKGPINRAGYGWLAWHCPECPKRRMLTHRIAWTLVNGEIPVSTPYVLHKCDNPPCCNPSHLFLGTQKENITDMINKGRQVSTRGCERKNVLLSPQKVIEIRDLRIRKGLMHKELAAMFGVSRATINSVLNWHKWSWVK